MLQGVPAAPASQAAWRVAPQDGEVEEFFRLPVEQVAQIMATTSEFKENCTLVICDWLLRHGYITPDMKGHLKLLTGLRSGDCS